MSKEKMRVELSIVFEIEETGEYPSHKSMATISAVGADGQEWTSGVRYEGNEAGDCIRTTCRMGRFTQAIQAMAMASSPIPSIKARDDDRTGFDIEEGSNKDAPADFSDLAAPAEEQGDEQPKRTPQQEALFNKRRNEFYASLDKDIQGWKYGRIRQFCTENAITVPVANGANKVDLAVKICDALKARETEEKNNETNN